jgi:BASS family bile acid:Na+ symporter
MIKKIKDLTLPLALVIGFLFHGFFAKLNVLIPYLIFTMLFVTLCSIEIKKMKVSGLHVALLAFQLIFSVVLFLLIKPLNLLLAQGIFVIILAPTALSAPVIAKMLGADLNTMVTSTLLSNLAVAVVAPFFFALWGANTDLPFFQSSLMVLSKVGPLILLPFALALLSQRFLPKFSATIEKRKNIPFYIWAFSLTIVIGSTINYIYAMDSSKGEILLVMMVLSMLICVVQFSFGRWVGKRYGDVVAGGQSVGQKNTILSIWMAQTYLNPLSSVIPAAYVLWQNLFNSYQLWAIRRKTTAIKNN